MIDLLNFIWYKDNLISEYSVFYPYCFVVLLYIWFSSFLSVWDFNYESGKSRVYLEN